MSLFLARARFGGISSIACVRASSSSTLAAPACALASHGSLRLYFESFGSPAAPTLLLINGLGSQCTAFSLPFVSLLVSRGLRVLRMDNRDAGLSGSPPPGAPPYGLADMAGDVLAVLDAARVARAHILGMSMGGLIAQHMAVGSVGGRALDAPAASRVASIIPFMTTTGEPDDAFRPTAAALAAISAPPAPAASGAHGYVAEVVAGQRVWGSPLYADPARWAAAAAAAYARAHRPEGQARQWRATTAPTASVAALLHTVRAPALVLHGARDTLLPWRCGARVAALLPGARFRLLRELGHDLPPQLVPALVEHILEHVERAEAAGARDSDARLRGEEAAERRWQGLAPPPAASAVGWRAMPQH